MATKRKTPAKTASTLAGETQGVQPKSEPVGPQKTELVERFSAGKIPLAADFEALIEVADAGRKAAGLSPDQTAPGTTGDGMQLDGEQRLAIKKSPADKVLEIDATGIAVKTGDGIDTTTNVLAVKVDTTQGLSIGPYGVGINIDTGTLQFSGNKLRVKYMEGPAGTTTYYHAGLSVMDTGPSNQYKVLGVHHDYSLRIVNPQQSSKGQLGVNPAPTGGLEVRTDNTGLGIKLQTQPTKSGLKVEAGGLAVSVGDGLTIGSDGKLNANVTASGFVRGMIIMFSGTPTDLPDGWVLCDGKTSGAPDLRHKFVLGADSIRPHSEADTNGMHMTGANNARSFSATTNPATPSINITVDGTILSEEQMPRHKHDVALRFGKHSNHLNFSLNYPNEYPGVGGTGVHMVDTISIMKLNAAFYTHNTNFSGNNQPHTHGASVTGGAHSHTVPISPPYFIIAFIMKT